jgi:ribonucleoside-diphosphate reductase beta chain
MSIFKPTKTSHLEQPMFLGEAVDVARYDVMRYPWIDKLTDRQLSFFWRPEEIDLTKDAIDFRERLTDNERHVFTSNLKYQTLLDSVQGRAPTLAFGSITSLPELETWIQTWAFSETIHSRSYTHIIRNVYTNPSEVLDTITITPEIIERADAVTKDYDNLIRMNAIREHFLQTPATDDHAHRKAIFRTLASVNVLEAIRFYVSFACSFSFAERALMEGNAKIITFIARDEALHLSGTQLMLQAMMYGDEGEEWQRAAAESLDDLYWLFDGAVQQEKDWAAYLFKDGSILGLNEAILGQYIEYIANVRLKALGLSPRYATVNDPLPWMRTYLSNDNVQVAPQEVQVSSYLTGAVDGTIDYGSLRGFEL